MRVEPRLRWLAAGLWLAPSAPDNILQFSRMQSFLCHQLELQAMDFQELVMFLQHLPTSGWSSTDVSELLSQAFVYKTLGSSFRHLVLLDFGVESKATQDLLYVFRRQDFL